MVQDSYISLSMSDQQIFIMAGLSLYNPFQFLEAPWPQLNSKRRHISIYPSFSPPKLAYLGAKNTRNDENKSENNIKSYQQ